MHITRDDVVKEFGNMLTEKNVDKVQQYIDETMEELSRKILEEEFDETLDEAFEGLLATINLLQSRVVAYRLKELNKKIDPSLDDLEVFLGKRSRGSAGSTK